MCACFCFATGLNKFFHTSAQMGISCIKRVMEKNKKNKFSKLTADSISKIFLLSIADKTDH